MNNKVKKVLITGQIRHGKTTLLQEVLNKHKNLGLSVYIEDPKGTDFNTEGYEVVVPYGHLGTKVDLLLLETEHDVNTLYFKRLLDDKLADVKHMLLVTCICNSAIDIKVADLFDTVINLNEESVEDACKRL